MIDISEFEISNLEPAGIDRYGFKLTDSKV